MNLEPQKINKIVVLGNGGSGKSYFSRKLSQVLHLDVIHLDRYYWNLDKSSSADRWAQIHKTLIQKPNWIIEGTQLNCLQERIDAADLVIWLDTNIVICIFRLFAKHFFSQKTKQNDGYPRRLFKNIKWAIKWRVQYKTVIQTLLSSSKKKIIILKNKKDITTLFLAFR